jgi:diacylglycerol kinase (ATP)
VPAETLLVLNPTAGRGGLDRFGRLESMLRSALGDVEVARTRRPADAIRIAREAARAGVPRLVVGGGDGTLSEVVTGVLEAGLGEQTELGLLPLGSGCDFARSVGLPRRVDEAIALLRAGRRARVDAGRVSYRRRDGTSGTRFFLNEAGFGLSGLTVELVNRAGKSFGPTLAFALGSCAAILRGASPEISLRVDGQTVFEGAVSLVVCANGRYFGSGMQIAPEAAVDDGVLDVVVVEAIGRLRLLGRFPSLYRGTHLRYPEVRVHRGRRVEATLRGKGPGLIDVDGEALGELPLVVEVLPKAIGLFGLPPAMPRAGP